MRDLLHDILKNSTSPEAFIWLEQVVRDQEKDFKKRPFYFSFSGVSRHFDKRGGIEATGDQLDALNNLVPGFSVKGWDQFRLARVCLLLVLAELDKETFLETIAALLNTADLREEAAIFSAFPLLPHQPDLVEAAVDGLRSNIIDIFDSIALLNPFPAKHFSNEAWNQMVLKTLFINRPIYQIAGIDTRANAELAAAVSSLARERWAAGRKLSPEAWRNCVGSITSGIASDLEYLLQDGDTVDREAAAILIAFDRSGLLDPLRENITAELDAISDGSLTWNSLGKKLETSGSLDSPPSKA